MGFECVQVFTVWCARKVIAGCECNSSRLMIQLIIQLLWLYWLTWGRKKMFHCDLTNSTSDSTDGSSPRFRLPHRQDRKCWWWPGVKKNKRKTKTKTKQRKNRKSIISKLLKGANKCESFISREVSSLVCYWNAEVAAPLKWSHVHKERAICPKNSSFIDGLLHICGDRLVGLPYCFPLKSQIFPFWLSFMSDY